jgi:hypothetical protein
MIAFCRNLREGRCAHPDRAPFEAAVDEARGGAGPRCICHPEEPCPDQAPLEGEKVEEKPE